MTFKDIFNFLTSNSDEDSFCILFVIIPHYFPYKLQDNLNCFKCLIFYLLSITIYSFFASIIFNKLEYLIEASFYLIQFFIVCKIVSNFNCKRTF